ncbi:MAG: GyrI-like domain-containing protein [Oscillospiraceae bacterium]|nr:GyrI-like domain-containing protein [Oscillospiraceae bacterium]
MKTAKKLPEKMDYKKAFKELYMPSSKPAAVDVPEMTFIAVDGKGDPNNNPDYQESIEILYGLSFTVKMSKLGSAQIEGYFEYVVPPLEGLWQTDGQPVVDNIFDKSKLCWTSMIRQPEFVTEDVFEWAKNTLGKKKPGLRLSKARLMTFTEGLCVQAMHKGSYDEEAATIGKMHDFMKVNGFAEDFSQERQHHEIYLSDPRRCAPERLKTVIRIPVRTEAGNKEASGKNIIR